MSRRKIKDRNIRNLGKAGGYSYSITLPMDMVQELGWRERQKLVVKKRGDYIIIKDWKKGNGK